MPPDAMPMEQATGEGGPLQTPLGFAITEALVDCRAQASGAYRSGGRYQHPEAMLRRFRSVQTNLPWFSY
jgi:hypothetical protein